MPAPATTDAVASLEAAHYRFRVQTMLTSNRIKCLHLPGVAVLSEQPNLRNCLVKIHFN